MVYTVALCDCRFEDKEVINLLSILDTSDLESVPTMHGLLQMEQLADHLESVPRMHGLLQMEQLADHLESVPRMHGLLQMEQLADHYQMDSDDLTTEWTSLLEQLTDTAANDRTLPSMYKLLHTEDIGLAAQLLTRLYAVAITLLGSTAGVERVFSQLKLMNMAHHNRLKEQTLQ